MQFLLAITSVKLKQCVYNKRATGFVQNTPVINYPAALNFTKRIGMVDYVVNTHFAEEGKSTLLSQLRDLILS